MANDSDIRLKITVDDTGAVRVLSETGEELQKVADKGDQATSAFSRFQAGIVAANQAIELGGRIFRALNDQLDRARTVEGVANGFKSLQGGAAVAADTLNKLKTATAGTVSEFELMKAANQAVQLGLPIDDFDKLAAAARKVGATMGRTTTEAIQDVTVGIGRQSVQVLDNLGIIVKADDAYKAFAETQGIVGRELTGTERKAAFTAAAIEALNEKAANSADVQESAAVAAERFGAALTDAGDQVSLFISKNEQLGGVLNFAAEKLTEFTVGLQALNNPTGALGLTRDLLTLQEELDAVNGKLEENRSVVSKLITSDEELIKTKKGLEGAIRAARERIVELNTEQLKAEKSALAEVAAQRAKEQALKASAAAAKKAAEANEALSKATLDNITGSKAYDEIIKKVAKGKLTDAEATEQIIELYEEQFKISKDLDAVTIELVAALQKQGTEAELTAEQIEKLVTSFGNLTEKQKKLTDDNKSGETDPFGSLLDLVGFDTLDREIAQVKEALSGLEEEFDFSLGESLGLGEDGQNAAIAGTAALIKNIDQIGESTEATAAAIGSVLGAAVGAYFGGAAGATAGAAVGAGIGELFGGLFSGGKEAGSAARDKIDAYFEDLLDANRVSLVINGQLTEIKNIAEEGFNNRVGTLFDFISGDASKGDLDAVAGRPFEGFDGLTEDVQATFTQIGNIFEFQFGVMEEILNQWGNVLANNVGGELNNLQILLQKLGISQEDLGTQLEDMWLNGKISGSDFLSVSAKIEDLYAVGIPGAVGATGQAFENIIESGGAGLQLVDGLKDVAAEAQEKGITTMEGLREELLAAGYDAEKVEQLFTALSDAGIDSLEKLLEISNITGAQIGAQLEQTGDFFEDVKKDLEETEEQLNRIRDKEVDLTFNIKTNVDDNTREWEDQIREHNGGIPNEGATQ